MDRSSLRDVIRRKLDDGDLPVRLPSQMYMGNGSGSPCAACGDPILPAQTEYEWGYPGSRQPLSGSFPGPSSSQAPSLPPVSNFGESSATRRLSVSRRQAVYRK
jgi:hypothetical protein